MRIHKLYEYLVELTESALLDSSSEYGSKKQIRAAAISIADEQIYRFNFKAPFGLKPQESHWDLLRLFLINASNGDGSPWINFPSGKKGYRRATTFHVSKALEDFTNIHNNASEEEKVDRFVSLINMNEFFHLDIPISLSEILETPKLEKSARGCDWLSHAKATVRFLERTGWFDPKKLASFMDDHGMGNSVSTKTFDYEKAWSFLKRFQSGDWHSIFGWSLKIPHLGLEKASNFFADAGFLNIAKPDVQMRKTYQDFSNSGKMTSKEAFFFHYKLTAELAQENDERPLYASTEFKARHLDRMIWLIGSGRLMGENVTAPGSNVDRRKKAQSILLSRFD